MNYEKIVLNALKKMGSGNGCAHSEDLLFAEILKNPKMLDKQDEIKNAIASLREKGKIVHDSVNKNWIRIK